MGVMAPLPELGEHHLLVFLLQVLILLALARGFGEACRALGHPRHGDPPTAVGVPDAVPRFSQIIY